MLYRQKLKPGVAHGEERGGWGSRTHYPFKASKEWTTMSTMLSCE
uniref:Uncharacterized protein n=1 Tax=Arundo donax TaxID=35708 RepID=A0A0A9B2T9_ARUDO